MEIKTSIKIIMVTYVQVMSHVKHFWFTEVDIRKKVVHLNHLFVAGHCVTQDRYDKTYEQQTTETNFRTEISNGSIFCIQ